MRSKHRELTSEQLESRVVLTTSSFVVSAIPIEDTPELAQSESELVHSLARGTQVSDEAFIAADNSTRTARDLGVINGTTSLRNEYVGRFDPQDVFRLELQSASTVNLRLRELATDVDLYLMDANREVIAQSVLTGSTDETLQLDLAAGEFFVVVKNYNQWTSTTYSLDISARATQEDRAGNTFDSAFDLGELVSMFELAGSVGGSDTGDVFQFQLPESTKVQFELSPLQADVDLFIYTSRGELVGESTEPNTQTEVLEGELDAGSYYVAVVPWETAESTYELSIKRVEPSEPIATPPENPSTPTAPQTTDPTPEPSTPAPTTLEPVPYYGNARDWGVNYVNAPEAWNAGYTGEGITVAVIDTGFQLDHVDLRDSYWVNSEEIAGDGIDNDRNGYVDDRFGWDFAGDDANPTSRSTTHGTHVAGVVTANRNSTGVTGVAYAAQVMPIQVLGDDGAGSTYDVAQGIRYAVDNGADIINLSLGGTNSPTIYNALRYAERNDVLVVAASGNESAATTAYPARHSATLPNVISVGAHGNNNRRGTFSNQVGASNSVQIDAPGVSIYSTVTGNRYSFLSGTSMASPYVAGVAALTLSANPDLTAAELRQALAQGATTQIINSDSLGAVNAVNSIALSSSNVQAGAGFTQTGSTASNARGSVTSSNVRSTALEAALVWQVSFGPSTQTSAFEAFDSDDEYAIDPTTIELIVQGHPHASHADSFAGEDFVADVVL